MTVKELIEKLNTYDLTLEVCCKTYYDGTHKVEIIEYNDDPICGKYLVLTGEWL